MYREISKELRKWLDQSERLPLLLRGARQVGKTYVVEKFGAENFERFHNINFEFNPEYAQCFESLDPNIILDAISGLSGQHIIPGKSLLFLDEIQNCPRAIMALRYFKERMPNVHVIAAGSLLEFVLKDEELSMPVGRIEYIYLKPLSFREFLRVRNFDILLEQIQTSTTSNPISLVFHDKLLQLVREYMLVGGMPAAIKSYLISQQFQSAQRQQTIILTTYRDDFGKYAKKSNHRYLQHVFEGTPGLIGQQIKYNKIHSEARSRDLKEAIRNLTYAGVIDPIYASKVSGLPLNAQINEKKFKLLFLDVGLANRAVGITINDLLNKDITLVNKGALAEQLVGQELLSYMDLYEEAKLHYWARDEQSSQAEVDYVISLDSNIVPIEVKAGGTGRLRSLHLLMKEKQLPLGVRISEQQLSMNHNLLSVPFYMLSELPRLVKQALKTINANNNQSQKT